MLSSSTILSSRLRILILVSNSKKTKITLKPTFREKIPKLTK